MKKNRHVPWILGGGALALGLWLILQRGWWQFFVGCTLLWFGWVSVKTALFASDREIAELTGETMSEETKKKFQDRF